VTSTGFSISSPHAPNEAVLDIFGDQVTIKVSSSQTAGAVTVIHSATPPAGGPPLHLHKADAEVFYVLDGTFLFVLDGERHEVGAGSTIFIPAGTRHQYQNVGDAVGNLLIILAPAGLDDFFVELDALLKQGGEPDMPAIAALHAKFGMELLGPPLAMQG